MLLLLMLPLMLLMPLLMPPLMPLMLLMLLLLLLLLLPRMPLLLLAEAAGRPPAGDATVRGPGCTTEAIVTRCGADRAS
jgi:hypothetical protein